jgi:hypothetical protein
MAKGIEASCSPGTGAAEGKVTECSPGAGTADWSAAIPDWMADPVALLGCGMRRKNRKQEPPAEEQQDRLLRNSRSHLLRSSRTGC